MALCFVSSLHASENSEGDLNYLSGCEIDLNNDNMLDTVILIDTGSCRELIALIKTKEGYDSFLVTTGKADMYLTCRSGKYVQKTTAGKGKKEGKLHETPGAYIQLTLPESSSVVYYWNGNGFTEVWTSD